MENKPKHPCVGICTATSFGDEICRGCKRKFNDVRDWNTYTDERKREILREIKQSEGEL